MGEVTRPQPVKLFAGLLTARPSALGEVRGRLEERLGPVDTESGWLDFDYTDYYEPEMGAGLKRVLWGFARLDGPEALVDLKLCTNCLEQALAVDGRRVVNIDPGYLAPARVVLASTKDFAHRLYLGKGIYGEVTLMYRRKGFQPLPWTYPDYRSEAYHRFFRELRRLYLGQLASYGSVVNSRSEP